MGQGAGMVKPIYGAHSELVALATYFAPCGRRYARAPKRPILEALTIVIHVYPRYSQPILWSLMHAKRP